MHPVILQALAAEHVKDILAAVQHRRCAHWARRARRQATPGLVRARPAVGQPAVGSARP